MALMPPQPNYGPAILEMTEELSNKFDKLNKSFDKLNAILKQLLEKLNDL